jgi:phosphoglycerate dehydrogenase-like enzyme
MKLMPGKSRLGLKCGNHIVNCARGGIVDEEGLLQALNDGIISSAALDVFENEPVSPDSELLQHPDFHGTPHVGAATVEAQSRVGIDIAKNIMDCLSGKSVKATVNSDLLK